MLFALVGLLAVAVTQLPTHAESHLPPAPTTLTATSGDGEILLEWVTTDDDSITKHQVSQGGGSWMDIPVGGHGDDTRVSYTVVGLINGASYTFAVLAVNADGRRGPPSTAGPVKPVAATATEGIAYFEPSNRLATLKGPTQVSWGETVVYRHDVLPKYPDRFAVNVPEGKKVGVPDVDCANCLAYISEKIGPSGKVNFAQSEFADWAGFFCSGAVVQGVKELRVTVPWGVDSDIGTTFDVGFPLDEELPPDEGCESKDSWAWKSTSGGFPSHFPVTIVGNPPAMPTGLIATPGNGDVRLSWDDPVNKSITGYGYEYRQSTDVGETWELDWTAIPGSDAATTGYTVTGLADDTPYTFAIRAVNSVGEG